MTKLFTFAVLAFCLSGTTEVHGWDSCEDICTAAVIDCWDGLVYYQSGDWTWFVKGKAPSCDTSASEDCVSSTYPYRYYSKKDKKFDEGGEKCWTGNKICCCMAKEHAPNPNGIDHCVTSTFESSALADGPYLRVQMNEKEE
ncbi:predicted protein [Thalassiosira pseudonana CCMP1335]|uniref:Uncharacterized protein n=1 Tax=Thalassiosira pseudonana TaxID=35128 RepID=B8CA93_THAPS|nr:predicted protein [Thalassiosira pseudonana CCMP1335]EED89641.1 predicted protein [Thalassiosira pseudonana CCMP1335]|eukprot:g11323.t1 g11323   contig5:601345-601770(+)